MFRHWGKFNLHYNIILNCAGGLAAQLNALSYAIWIEKNTKRKVTIRFREEVLERYPLVCQELFNNIELRYDVNKFDEVNTSKRSTHKELKLPTLLRISIKKLFLKILVFFRFIIESNALTLDELDKIAGVTRYLYGYQPDVRILRDSASEVRARISQSNYPNFLQGAGEVEAVSVHWRIGDYISNSKVNETHGSVSANSIIEAIIQVLRESQLSKLYVYSDSPKRAQELLQNELPKNITVHFLGSNSVWSDLFEMTRAKYFLGTNSYISIWAAISLLESSPSVLVYLPDQWFKNLPKGFSHYPTPLFEDLRVRTYNVGSWN